MSTQTVENNTHPAEEAQQDIRYTQEYRDLPQQMDHEKQEELLLNYHKTRNKEILHVLIEHNQRLVYYIASKYMPKRSFDFMDVVQDGNMGLMRALEKYDPDKGYSLSTYATWWIKQSIMRGLNKQRTIGIPVHVEDYSRKYKKIISQVQEDTGEMPSDNYLMEKLGVDINMLRSIRQCVQGIASLDKPVTDEADGDTLGDFVKDNHSPQPDHTVIAGAMQDCIESALNRLAPFEKEIIVKRFGLFGNVSRTLEQIAKEENTTMEYIRKVERKALMKLRNPAQPEYKNLREFWAP